MGKRRLDSDDEGEGAARVSSALKSLLKDKKKLEKSINKIKKKLTKMDAKHPPAPEPEDIPPPPDFPPPLSKADIPPPNMPPPKYVPASKRGSNKEDGKEIPKVIEETPADMAGMTLDQWIDHRKNARATAKQLVDSGQLIILDDGKGPLKCDRCGSGFHTTKHCPKNDDLSQGDNLADGMWECFKCSFHNEKKRTQCYKCNSLYRSGYVK